MFKTAKIYVFAVFIVFYTEKMHLYSAITSLKIKYIFYISMIYLKSMDRQDG